MPPDGRMDRQINTSCEYDGDLLVYEGELRDRWHSGDGTAVNDLHWWTLRLTVEPRDGTIVAVEATPKRLPFPECPLVSLQVKRLEGISLRRGFRDSVKEILGSVEGCTHLHTLAISIWSTQVISRYLELREDIEGNVPPSVEHAELMTDACRGWRADSAVIEAGHKRTRRPGPWVEGMPVSKPEE